MKSIAERTTRLIAATGAAVLVLGLPFAASADTTKKDVVQKSPGAVRVRNTAFAPSRSAANQLTLDVRRDITSKPQPFSGVDFQAVSGPLDLNPTFQRGHLSPPIGSSDLLGPYVVPTGPTRK